MAKRKVQKDKQRSTKHTPKTKDRVTRTSLKHGVIYTPYAGAAGMLLHMNGKFTMGKLQVIEINCFLLY